MAICWVTDEFFSDRLLVYVLPPWEIPTLPGFPAQTPSPMQSVLISPELISTFSSDAGDSRLPKTLIYLALTELSLSLSLSPSQSTHLQALKCHFYLPVPDSARLYSCSKLPHTQSSFRAPEFESGCQPFYTVVLLIQRSLAACRAIKENKTASYNRGAWTRWGGSTEFSSMRKTTHVFFHPYSETAESFCFSEQCSLRHQTLKISFQMIKIWQKYEQLKMDAQPRDWKEQFYMQWNCTSSCSLYICTLKDCVGLRQQWSTTRYIWERNQRHYWMSLIPQIPQHIWTRALNSLIISSITSIVSSIISKLGSVYRQYENMNYSHRTSAE